MPAALVHAFPPLTPLTLASSVEGPLLTVLTQLVLIIAVARIAAYAFRRLGQPAAVGEIAAGLILGPSLFGLLAPHYHAIIFTAEVAPTFDLLSQIGLILLLFLIGLEFDFSHLRVSGRAASFISISGIALPFALGCLLALYLHPILAPSLPFTGFALFMGTAMSITAIPILGRIMMELNLTRSRMGSITITAAAVDDALGWIMLATVTALVEAQFNPLLSLRMIALTVGFGAFMLIVARPLLLRWATWTLDRNHGELSLPAMTILLVLILLCSIVTSWIGIFAIFGAFLVGAIFSSHERLRLAASRRLADFVTAFFLPVFFTYTGLKTDLTQLDTTMWGLAALVLIVAVVGKFGGCALAARLGGLNWRESVGVGVMMNTRALMELIVINVGLQLGVIPPSLFSMLVLMALLTTVMATPTLLYVMRKDPELQALLAESDFRSWVPAPAPPKPRPVSV